MIEIAVKIEGDKMVGGVKSNKATPGEIAISIQELKILGEAQKQIFLRMLKGEKIGE